MKYISRLVVLATLPLAIHASTPQSVETEIKGIMKKMPPVPKALLNQVDRISNQWNITSQDVLNALPAPRQVSDSCVCTFVEWPNQKDITSLRGKTFTKTHAWPQEGFRTHEKAKFCNKQTPYNYTVGYLASEADVQKAFQKTIGMRLNAAQRIINTSRRELSAERNRLNKTQRELAKEHQIVSRQKPPTLPKKKRHTNINPWEDVQYRLTKAQKVVSEAQARIEKGLQSIQATQNTLNDIQRKVQQVVGITVNLTPKEVTVPPATPTMPNLCPKEKAPNRRKRVPKPLQ